MQIIECAKAYLNYCKGTPQQTRISTKKRLYPSQDFISDQWIQHSSNRPDKQSKTPKSGREQ